MSDKAVARVTLLADESVEKFLPQFAPHIEAAAQAAADHENLAFHVNVLLTADDEIQELNRSYRGIDRVTDVLSFPASDFTGHIAACEDAEHDEDGLLELGDVAICVPRALQQAAELEHSREREIAFLTLHAVLHLMGYDHETPEDEEKMTGLQRDILLEAGVDQRGR